MKRRFVVISGLPGSGKTTLGRQLAAVLNLPMIDKDDILSRLFETRGAGGAEWRRRLSQESDSAFQENAVSSHGAVLVSFWHVPGMAADSGTPTDWLSTLSADLVHVHCVCQPEVAARRFLERERHPGHLDHHASFADVLVKLRELASLGTIDAGPCIDVDTSRELDIEAVIRRIQQAFGDAVC